MISISRLFPNTPEIATCARWRIAAFSDVLGTDVEQEQARLNEFASGTERQAGLLAYWNGEPAGVCLLAPNEIEPCHPVTPWLAGLFVSPKFRGRGLAKALVGAVEQEALRSGNARIYLYTDDAENFYRKLGWIVDERGVWHDMPMSLMSKILAP